MRTIRIGGVPEHFNQPWHWAIQQAQFAHANINLSWTNYHAGSGAMAAALRANELDVAVMLTESAVRDISLGSPSRILQTYINSPLVWGVHVAAESSYTEIPSLRHAPVAISRFGSGSHLMAYLATQANGWQPESSSFVQASNLAGIQQALLEGTAAWMMWEKWMTKPLVDAGILRRVAEVPSPWAAFVVVARLEALAQYEAEIKAMLHIINRANTAYFELPDALTRIAEHFRLSANDVLEWHRSTTWSTQIAVREQDIAHAQSTLHQLALIPRILPIQALLADFCALLD